MSLRSQLRDKYSNNEAPTSKLINSTDETVTNRDQDNISVSYESRRVTAGMAPWMESAHITHQTMMNGSRKAGSTGEHTVEDMRNIGTAEGDNAPIMSSKYKHEEWQAVKPKAKGKEKRTKSKKKRKDSAQAYS